MHIKTVMRSVKLLILLASTLIIIFLLKIDRTPLLTIDDNKKDDEFTKIANYKGWLKVNEEPLFIDRPAPEG